MRAPRLSFALAASLVACGAAPQPKALPHAAPAETFRSRMAAFPPAPSVLPASTEPPKAAGSARATPLLFQLNGRSFPLPLVRGTVAGEPTWMLVDTGANSHVITGWMAKKVRFKLRELGEVGSDHTGKAVMAYSVEKPQIVIDGWGALAEGPMLVTEVPEAIEKLGIGVFISPQWLGAEKDGVVLDLVGKQMRVAPFDAAVQSLGAWGKDLAPAGGSLCEDSGSAIRGLGFVLPAAVEGHAVRLLVDTGAHHTDLLTSTRAGKQLGARSVASTEQMYAASGLVRTRVVQNARVSVGQWGIVSDIDLVPGASDPVCPRDGVVSMDVLKSCVLVLGRKQLVARCGG